MSEWENKSLLELADFVNGYAFKPSDWGKEGLPIVRIEQLKNPNASCDYYSGLLPEHNLIRDGDLVFSWSASLFLKIWKDGNAALNQHLFKVKNFEGIDRLFLKYLIEFNLPELVKAAHGSTMQHITRKELKEFRVNLPYLKEEQAQIATVLSGIDKAIEQAEAIIAKQQRIKAGLMHDLLTKGIDEYGNIRDEATHEFKDSSLGRIPKEWLTDILDNAIRIIDCKHITPKFIPSGYPFLRPRNIKIDGLDLSDVDYVSEQDFRFLTEKHEPHRGDIVFSRNASFGVPCYIEMSEKFAIGQDVVVMTETNANTRYIYFLLLSNLIERQIAQLSTGSTFGRINLAFIRKLIIPLPVIEEQLSIVSVLDAQLEQIKATKQYINKLRKLKAGLMQDLLTGKVPVHALLETQD